MRWIILATAAILAACANTKPADYTWATQQIETWQTASYEVRRAMADCDGRRYQGKLDGFVGAHHCARARAEKIWAGVSFPHTDLVTRFWDYNGNLARALSGNIPISSAIAAVSGSD